MTPPARSVTTARRKCSACTASAGRDGPWSFIDARVPQRAARYLGALPFFGAAFFFGFSAAGLAAAAASDLAPAFFFLLGFGGFCSSSSASQSACVSDSASLPRG